MKKICISFSKFTDVAFLSKAELIYSSLNGNPNFTTLAALLLALKAATDKYREDLAAAANRDRIAVAKKNQSRLELEMVLKAMGLAVMAEANGDETLLVQSGFTLYKTPEARYITNPGNVTLSQGITSGEMVSMVKSVAGAISYVHQITSTLPGDATEWQSNTTSARKFIFGSLVPGRQYWVRVAVIGARNQVAYSNVGSWYAQ